MDTAIAAPLQEQERIRFLDALRGFALLGILIMNSMGMSQPHYYYDTMDLAQPITGPNYWAWWGMMFFAEGSMRGLFSILFGAGTILLLLRLQKTKSGLEPADIYYRRLLWLLIFGLINAFVLLWPGDILYPYALCGLLLFPFRNWSPRHLLLGALFFLSVATYRGTSDLWDAKKDIRKGEAAERLVTQKQKLSPEQEGDLAKYKGMKEKMSPEGIAKAAQEEAKKLKGRSYGEIFLFFRGINMKLESKTFYSGYIWDILIFFFIGMAVYKSGFLEGRKPVLWYGILALVGIGVGLTINYIVLNKLYSLRFSRFEMIQWMPFSLYEIRRVFQTVGYLSLLILLYKLIPFRKLFNLLIPVGQMAFTNYLCQSIIMGVIFYGFNLFNELQRYQVYYIVAAVWAFQILTSHLWLRYFRFGPFEWAWRSLTYWKRQPMKRGRHQEPSPLILVRTEELRTGEVPSRAE